MNRYAPNIKLTDFGHEGQERLLDSKVLIVGAGALGATCGMYLAGSGIGIIRIVDFDTIDLSNLQRQVFFKESECGSKKVCSLTSSIRALNSGISVEPVDGLFKKDNSLQLAEGMNLIIDAADNPATTYLVEETANNMGIPYITAGVTGWKAQILTHFPGSLSFSDIFPRPESEDNPLPCSIAGVFGPLTGVVASLEASEAVKLLAGKGKTYINSLLTVDLLNNEFKTLNF